MTYARTHAAPSITSPASTVSGVIYTCPMHPQIPQVRGRHTANSGSPKKSVAEFRGAIVTMGVETKGVRIIPGDPTSIRSS